MTTTDPNVFLQKIRRLNQALVISGAINIAVLGLLSYWIVRERPPSPYFELKPATEEQQALPLADHRGYSEVIQSLYQLPFEQLVAHLEHSQLVESGYAERDLALAALISFHHFDIDRALLGEGTLHQKRLLLWKNKITGESVPLKVYPGLTDRQFESIMSFAKTERWPLTTMGQFLLLKKQQTEGNQEESLKEAFHLTPEFSAIEMLFNRSEGQVPKEELLTLLLEGTWPDLARFASQQKQAHDLSAARRQKLLLDYVKGGSKKAASLLLRLEGDFAAKKLDDGQVIAMLKLLPQRTPESEKFALDLLLSPRSTEVWQQAAQRLYAYAGEPMPKEWNYKVAVERFTLQKIAVPTKLPIEKVATLPVVASVPKKLNQPKKRL
jgi:hypothetical protein